VAIEQRRDSTRQWEPRRATLPTPRGPQQ
jgi:hypothetical protein